MSITVFRDSVVSSGVKVSIDACDLKFYFNYFFVLLKITRKGKTSKTLQRSYSNDVKKSDQIKYIQLIRKDTDENLLWCNLYLLKMLVYLVVYLT